MQVRSLPAVRELDFISNKDRLQSGYMAFQPYYRDQLSRNDVIVMCVASLTLSRHPE